MNMSADKDEKIDISLSSFNDGEQQSNNIDVAKNDQTVGNRFNEVDLRTAQKTKKIEEDSDDEKREEEIDKTAQKMVANPFRTHSVNNNQNEMIGQNEIAKKRFASEAPPVNLEDINLENAAGNQQAKQRM